MGHCLLSWAVFVRCKAGAIRSAAHELFFRISWLTHEGLIQFLFTCMFFWVSLLFSERLFLCCVTVVRLPCQCTCVSPRNLGADYCVSVLVFRPEISADYYVSILALHREIPRPLCREYNSDFLGGLMFWNSVRWQKQYKRRNLSNGINI